MNNSLKNLPNLFTLGNLLCGLLGIMTALNGEFLNAFLLMGIAALLDFFDGFLARLLKVSGEMGKQLDSLADLVTFGVLPGIMAWQTMENSGFCPANGFCINRYVWLVFPLAAAWRLAKFNIETRESKGFFGVPTPISGLALASLTMAIHLQTPLSTIYGNFYFLKGFPILLALLMISDFEMLAFKIKKQDKQNIFKLIFLGIAITLAIVFKADAGPIIYLFYVLYSLFANFALKLMKNG
jgi:CDP-diacylglycerol--serine O-phosphatidyltransferase